MNENPAQRIVAGHDLPYDSATSIDLAQARLMIRGRKGPAALEVVRKYITHGSRIGDQVVLLRAVKISGTFLTMPGWVAAFEAKRFELSERLGAVPPLPRATYTCRGRAADQKMAARVLDRLGIGAAKNGEGKHRS
jgi:hypothetical protein